MAKWTPTADQLAQCSHFFIATSIVFGCSLFGVPWWACGLAVVAWGAVKEFWWDIRGPEHDSIEDSVEDFFWYQVGNVAGLVLLLLRWFLT